MFDIFARLTSGHHQCATPLDNSPVWQLMTARALKNLAEEKLFEKRYAHITDFLQHTKLGILRTRLCFKIFFITHRKFELSELLPKLGECWNVFCI